MTSSYNPNINQSFQKQPKKLNLPPSQIPKSSFKEEHLKIVFYEKIVEKESLVLKHTLNST